MLLPSSAELLQRLTTYHSNVIDLSLRPHYRALLEKLGAPHRHLPPVIHVAGTNGKGSTLAFIRAMLEASGKRVHAYTSPHLVRFHERIRLAGQLIEEEMLARLLLECEAANEGNKVTFFELTTAVALLAFSRVPADAVLLEVGLGGRLDATNIIDHPALTIISRISYDHREFLGNSLAEIAGEKAGIFKAGVPAILAPQESVEVRETLLQKAAALNAPVFMHGRDWHFKAQAHGFTYTDAAGEIALPMPNLIGAHQIANAATAIAALRHLKFSKSITGGDLSAPSPLAGEGWGEGVKNAYWPARLQRLQSGPLVSLLPRGSELWLDGGHNDSAGSVLADQAKAWQAQDGKPLLLIYGMLASKHADEFLQPLAGHLSALCAVPIPSDMKTMPAADAAHAATLLHIPHVHACADAEEAVKTLISLGIEGPMRILITGSLYLAGHILRENS